jgi:hypothetical protein
MLLLTGNMCVQRILADIALASNFATFLLSLGNGRAPTRRFTGFTGADNIILLPEAMCLPHGATVCDHINSVSDINRLKRSFALPMHKLAPSWTNF